MKLLLILLALFVFLPWLEVYILFRIAEVLGGFETFALVIFTGVLGAYLARQQGTATLRKIHETMNRGEMPTAEIVDGVLIFCAGLVLITPGIITDITGFLLLVPALRAAVRRLLLYQLRRRFTGASFTHFESTAHTGSMPPRQDDEDVIDVEHRNLD